MQIVINIPEVFYEALRNTDEIISGQRSGKTLMSVIFNAVANGTPLPKVHGRLGDLDALEEEISSWGMNDYEPLDFIDAIDDAPTVIEADKEVEE